MKEPTASAIAAASGLSLVSGSVLGLPADALMAGFGGGLIALSFGDPMTWGRKAISVAVSTVAAAYLAPVMVYLLPMPDAMPFVVALKGLAFGIGFGAQKILPAFMERAIAVIKPKGDAS